MKTYLRHAIFVGIFVTGACSKQTLDANGQVNSKNVAGPQKSAESSGDEASGQTADSAPAHTETASAKIDTLPAVVPVAIAGASLSCSKALPTKITCQTRVYGALADLRPIASYIVSKRGADWSPIPSTVISPGVYQFALPAGVPAVFAVALELSSTQYISSILGDGVTAFNDVVKDGEFDYKAHIVGETFEFATSATIASLGFGWSVGRLANSKCTTKPEDVVIEFQTAQSSNQSYAGLTGTFIELDSFCTATDVGDNIVVSQKLSTSKNHLYNLSYRARRRVDGINASTGVGAIQGIIARIDGEAIDTRLSLNQTWTKYVFDLMPQNAVVLSFEDTGPSDNFGSALDAVEAFDLGIPPP
ncbi:MAG: hypothetical protein H7249_05435 [Chitinophagaceae bacterium]|nr:hypothetical protein [Oligoflexus sp.]